MDLQALKRSEADEREIKTRLRVIGENLARVRDEAIQAKLRMAQVIMRIHEARNRLSGLGCFKDVAVFIDTYKGPDALAHGIEVTFEVREVSLAGAKLNTSVGNNEGTVATGGVLRNLLGRGEEATAEYSHGTKRTSSFHTTFTKPFHNDATTVLSSSVYQEASELPWAGYKEMDRGMLLSLAFNSAPQVQQKLVLEGVWRHLSCLSRSTAFAVREQAGHSLKAALRHTLIVDRRDDTIFPSDGVAFTLKNELAGLGGDIGFLKNELDLQVNVPLPKDVVIQGSLVAGHLLPLRNNKTHCIVDRFLLGGPMNIRGFEMCGVGPHSDGCALGADMYWAAALHTYSPLPLLGRGGSISDKFRLHAFVNTGNIGDFVLRGQEKCQDGQEKGQEKGQDGQEKGQDGQEKGQRRSGCQEKGQEKGQDGQRSVRMVRRRVRCQEKCRRRSGCQERSGEVRMVRRKVRRRV
ncbi:Sorting and assembly machinery component 50 [Chionoecetes opilio]|uniref:Sorting and assembly machinery component 50 n=1 Tax=Chionoecetes opilio TaxID=41210 RepID=A0A8J8WD30_CHIOP|nr:Sorting and assembly machinery component 50 [Chionoecetes opilio]